MSQINVLAGAALNLRSLEGKAAAHYQLNLGAGETAVIRLRLSNAASRSSGGSYDASRADRSKCSDHHCWSGDRGIPGAVGAGSDRRPFRGWVQTSPKMPERRWAEGVAANQADGPGD